MALQGNYKVVIDYTIKKGVTYSNVVVVGRASCIAEVVRKIEEKFGTPPDNKACCIISVEYLGRETF